jgi:hypothetical protein
MDNIMINLSKGESGRNSDVTEETRKENVHDDWLMVLGLTNDDLMVIDRQKQCLNDRIINAAQKLLKQKYPTFNGLTDTIVLAAGHVTLSGQSDVPFVQIVHDERHHHWLVVTNINCNSDELLIYCCDHMTPSAECLVIITRFVKMRCRKLKLHVMNVARQSGATDCGLFAIAFAESLLNGMDPVNVLYRQSVMRSHLVKCLIDGNVVAFPTVSLRNNRKRAIRSLDVELFCVCRSSNARNEPMIQCDDCSDWFHPSCVGIQDSTLEDLLETTKPFSCESCRL